MENLTPVTLVVKAANQKIADQTVECALNWTVKKLKQHLSAVYPNKPIATQQRIIYSGQLLQDDLTLKDVLRQYEPNQTIHTVHLVCSPTSSTTDAPSFQSSSHPNTSVDNGNVSIGEGLRHRHPHNTDSSQQSAGLEMPTPPSPFMYPTMTSQGYSPEQMMWLQHTYAQYMAQYMQYYQSGLYSQVAFQPVAAYEGYFNPMANVNIVPNNNVEMNPVLPAPVDVNRGAMPRQAGGGGGPEIVRMNAQGGPVVNDDDEDMQNRDWLDWIYVFLRFSILLCILYFYSTFGRIIATLVLVVFIYLYQVGWFQLNRRNAAPLRQPNVVPAAEQPQAPVGDSDHEGETAVVDPVPPPGPAEPSGLAVAWTFVVSFFSSLAPQQPPAPVNIN